MCNQQSLTKDSGYDDDDDDNYDDDDKSKVVKKLAILECTSASISKRL